MPTWRWALGCTTACGAAGRGLSLLRSSPCDRRSPDPSRMVRALASHSRVNALLRDDPRCASTLFTAMRLGDLCSLSGLLAATLAKGRSVVNLQQRGGEPIELPPPV